MESMETSLQKCSWKLPLGFSDQKGCNWPCTKRKPRLAGGSWWEQGLSSSECSRWRNWTSESRPSTRWKSKKQRVGCCPSCFPIGAWNQSKSQFYKEKNCTKWKREYEMRSRMFPIVQTRPNFTGLKVTANTVTIKKAKSSKNKPFLFLKADYSESIVDMVE